MFRHISDVLQDMDLEGRRLEAIKVDINRMTNRQIAKLLLWLEEKNEPLTEIQKSAIKKQFRFLEEDFLGIVKELTDDQYSK